MGEIPAVLAIDGGNSKADLTLHADDGTLLAAIRRPGFSHQTVGVEQAASALTSAVAELQEAAGLAPGMPAAQAGSFCLAGADLPVDDELLSGMLDEAAIARRWELRNDVFAVLRAGTDDGVGIAVVCGAGMNAVGLASDGREVRYPALGDISGDEAAGGGWLGLKALGAAIRAEDGRGPPTELLGIVTAHFGVDDPLDITEQLYTGSLGRHDLLALVPSVMAAAAAGDTVARGLVDAVAEELIVIVRATMERLDLAGAGVAVVLGGGLFRSADGLLQQQVAEGVMRHCPKASVRPLTSPPVLGAALLGFDALGAGPDVMRRVQQGITRIGRGPLSPLHAPG